MNDPNDGYETVVVQGSLARNRSAAAGHLGEAIVAAIHAVSFVGGLVPFVALALTLATYAVLGISVSFPGLLLAASGSWIIYIVERTVAAGPEDDYNHADRKQWLVRHRRFVGLLVSILVGTFLVSLTSVVTRPVLLLVVGMMLLAATYCLPVLPGRTRGKTVWFAKPFLIAAGWSLGTVVLPAAIDARPLLPVALLALYRFVFLLPNTLLSDVFDVAGDRLAGHETLTGRIGSRIVRIVVLLTLLTPILAFALHLLVPLPIAIVVDSALALTYLILVSQTNTSSKITFLLALDTVAVLPVIAAFFPVSS